MIKLNIWHKLALAMMVIVSLVLITGMLLIQNSFRVGFLSYLNDLESQRILKLEKRLIKNYQLMDDWSFLPSQPRGWRRYVENTLHPLPRRRPRKWRDRPPPPPKDGMGFFRPPPPPHQRERHSFKSPQDAAPRLHNEKEDHDHSPPPRPPKSKNPFQYLASKDDVDGQDRLNNKHPISLYNPRHELLFGREQKSSTIIRRPLYVDKEIIAYLYIKPFTKLTSQLDQNFVNQQTYSFIKIMLIAFVLALLGAWLLALYFRKRMVSLTQMATQLSSGNYQYRANNKQKDELGQLANDLNYLGETLEQNQVSRQQWIADISHELRTPLSILKGELEALEDGIRPLNADSVKSLSAEVQRLGKLVEDLYQLSLSDLGALNYVKERVDIYTLIKEVVSFFEQRFIEQNISVSFYFDQSAAFIFADEKRLFQLFSNLFENTARYTDKGGELQIHCLCQNKQITILLEDSKPAVLDPQLPHLFERLYRAEASRNRAFGGAGLGLSIVKAIADAHNIKIIGSHSALGGLTITLEMEQY